MKTTLNPTTLAPTLAALSKSNAAYSSVYPGEPIDRQPVHTIYGGGHLFKKDTARRLGDVALASLRDYAPDFATFARAIGLRGSDSLPETAAAAAAIDAEFVRDPIGAAKANPAAAFARTVYNRVVDKLTKEPAEDFRIDFEDGYGVRTDADEDAHAHQAALETALGMKENSLPPFIGIRIKNFGDSTHARGIRTLDIFLTALSQASGKKLPANFVVMLPKLVSAQQVATMVEVLEQFEAAGLFPAASLKMEFMVETTQSVIDVRGVCPLPDFVRAAKGRCIAAALGVYDYTASVGVTAQEQKIDHRACDFARHVMQVSLGASGLYLSDGATNIMPSALHVAPEGGTLSPQHTAENRAAVHSAWKLNFTHVRRSLAHGWYQGWDLNPAQLPIRYAAVYSYFLEYLPDATARLRNFVEKAARATLVRGAGGAGGGGVFDDAATAQGLLTFYIQGVRRRAISAEELAATGLSQDEIRMRSFIEILKHRQCIK
ncbi:MAG: phosphoenolpyruvate kinase [Phycisphaerae bacterium]|nr:phosphoenolpyruvate kinase [Phycisphaerae bacterium]